MLPEEIDQIVAMARSQEYVDLSHRIMALTACDKGLFQASFSTVYRVLKKRNLMTARGPGGAHNGNSRAPVRKALTGPNQRWCWDISYLMTFQKGVYLYLYLLLDEYSRKAIQSLCEDHGMPQLFARSRTPNDNPFIESAFSTVKRAPEYPGRFLDDGQAVAYFGRYFTWPAALVYSESHNAEGCAKLHQKRVSAVASGAGVDGLQGCLGGKRLQGPPAATALRGPDADAVQGRGADGERIWRGCPPGRLHGDRRALRATLV